MTDLTIIERAEAIPGVREIITLHRYYENCVYMPNLVYEAAAVRVLAKDHSMVVVYLSESEQWTVAKIGEMGEIESWTGILADTPLEAAVKALESVKEKE